MCGIIYIKRQKGLLANKAIIRRYQKQKARGSEGFGFLEIKDNKLIGIQRAETEAEIIKQLEESKADEILFHHRYPTSTPNFIEATHPILVSHKDLEFDYFVVHNGVISNDDDLKPEHEKEGFKYNTLITKKWITTGNTYSTEIYNDSESLAIEMAKHIEYKTPIKARGSIAVIVLQINKKSKIVNALYYGRNEGNPLGLEKTGDLFGLSSENGMSIDSNILTKIDYEDFTFTKEKVNIGIYNTTNYYNNNYYNNYYNTNQYKVGDTFENSDFSNDMSEDSIYDDYYDYSDDDVNIDFECEIANLKEMIREAYRSNDWDSIDELEDELHEIEDQHKQWKLSTKKNKRLGF